MKSKFILFIIMLLLFPVLLGGCWDRTEVDELAIVVGVGIDQIPGKQSKLVTVQIVNPAKIKNAGSEGGGPEKSFIVLASQGNSFFEAIRNLTKTSPRRLFFAHNKIVVLGKDFAKSGISEVMDYMDRDREFRRINWILVTMKTAKEVLETEMDIEKLPSRGLETMLSSLKNQAITYPINRNEFLMRLKSDLGVSYAPIIHVKDVDKEINLKLEQATGEPLKSSETKVSKKILIQETAIFKNNRFIGILTEEESKGLLWLINKLKGDTVVIPHQSGEDEKAVTVDIFEGHTKITPHITEKGITMEILCTGKATLRETENIRMELKNLKIFKQLEQETDKILKTRVERTITKAQKGLKADFVGFGEQIHNNNPLEWNRINQDWDQRFPQVKYELTIKIKIQNMGKITNSATLRI